jgi:hypothetical protein
MSQKSSLLQLTRAVSRSLTPDTPRTSFGRSPERGSQAGEASAQAPRAAAGRVRAMSSYAPYRADGPWAAGCLREPRPVVAAEAERCLGGGGTQAGNVGHVGDVSDFAISIPQATCSLPPLTPFTKCGRAREVIEIGKALTSLSTLTWRGGRPAVSRRRVRVATLYDLTRLNAFAPEFAGDPSTGLAAPGWVGKMKRAG